MPTTRQSDTTSDMDKGSRRRKRLLSIVMLCFVAWAGVTFWNQAEVLQDKLAKAAVLEAKLHDTKQINEQLQLEITRLNDDEYIEQRARKDFQMISPGETLFTTSDAKDN